MVRVGGHPRRDGRFWRPLLRLTTPTPDRHPGGSQIAADRLATDGGRLFDVPQRPAQSPQRHYLLFLVLAQDVAHPQRWTRSPPVGVNVSVLRVVAGFQVSINGRFWVSTEGPSRTYAGGE